MTQPNKLNTVIIISAAIFATVVVSNISLVSDMSNPSLDETGFLFMASEILAALFISLVLLTSALLILAGEKSKLIQVFGFFATLFFIDRAILSAGYLL